MNHNKVISKIESALMNLYLKEKLLIINQTNEVTIASQLACLLREPFNDWDVDIEYNRSGNNIKKDVNDNNRYPDILIHNRKLKKEPIYDPDNNFVVIEVKGYWNNEPRVNDESKLQDMHKKYGYQYFFRIELEENKGILIPIKHND